MGCGARPYHPARSLRAYLPTHNRSQNKHLVSRVVLVAVPGLDADTFRAARAHLPTLGGALGEPVSTIAKSDAFHSAAWFRGGRGRWGGWRGGRAFLALPAGRTLAASTLNHTLDADQVVRTLFHVPLTKKQQRERQADGTPTPACPLPASHYRATLAQLRERDFPLPDVAPDGRVLCPPGYASTQPCGREGGPEHEMVAIDCEMVLDADRATMLARVTAVAADGAVLMDRMVAPERPVADYVTQYSGVTPAMLEGVTATVADVRAEVMRYVAAETLLVGHALENDLRHLRLLHANVVDTSILYPHNQARARWKGGKEAGGRAGGPAGKGRPPARGTPLCRPPNPPNSPSKNPVPLSRGFPPALS